VAHLDGRRLRLLSRTGEGGEGEKKEEKEEKEEKKDIEKSQIEPRFEGTNGQPVVSLAPYIKSAKAPPKEPVVKEKSAERKEMGGERRTANPGIKRRRSGKAGDENMPPTPWGCEWLKTDDGWNLWRYWSEKDSVTGERIKKSRYAGYLSHDAWKVMKGYDYETFISIIGQRFRRHGQR
jgi:hypothetical protein